MARLPAMSMALPPRKCRMRTPRFQPSSLPLMNSSNVPWNHVAHMRPSACQTVRKRSHKRASRHTAQFSTSSRMTRLSSSITAIEIPRAPSPGPAKRRAPVIHLRSCVKELNCRVKPGNTTQGSSDVAALDLFGQRLDGVGDIFEVGVDGERLAVGVQRVLVVADLLQHQA